MKTLAGICLIVCALIFAPAVWAQAVSQISGTVQDQSGAVVPGVEVTLTQTDTGARRSVVTDDAGFYVLTNLPLGPYRLEASKTGFTSYVQTGIELQVGSNPVIPVALGVGEVTQRVQVPIRKVCCPLWIVVIDLNFDQRILTQYKLTVLN